MWHQIIVSRKMNSHTKQILLTRIFLLDKKSFTITIHYILWHLLLIYMAYSLNLSFYTFPFCALVNFNYQPINQFAVKALFGRMLPNVYFICS